MAIIFDASALAGGGKITFKLYTNDPSRIVSDVLPSQPQIRLCFCSDGEDPIDWTQNTDNFMIWDLQEYPLKANEWNTIEIEYDQAARYGRFDPRNLNYFNIQVGISEGEEPFTLLLDDLRILPNTYDNPNGGDYQLKDHAMGARWLWKRRYARGTGNRLGRHGRRQWLVRHRSHSAQHHHQIALGRERVKFWGLAAGMAKPISAGEET